MLTGIHLLLSYTCNFECDHCFLYSSPRAEGTMTLPQIKNVLEESKKIGTVEWIYFEGGEPFLYYQTMLEGARQARQMGFRVGIVTNSYWAISKEDAEVWMKPLADIGVEFISISDDSFHYGDEEEEDRPTKRALEAAEQLGIPTSPICIQMPFVEAMPGEGQNKGAPVIGGGAMFKGRAVEKLTAGLPRWPCQEFTRCPHEDFENPSRVHLDSFGHVHLCQGLSMGNMWKTPLSELVKQYDPHAHPICGPMLRGGPAELARVYNVPHEDEYIDECHFCYLVRRALVKRFPEYLAPRQVYGLEDNGI